MDIELAAMFAKIYVTFVLVLALVIIFAYMVVPLWYILTSASFWSIV